MQLAAAKETAREKAQQELAEIVATEQRQIVEALTEIQLAQLRSEKHRIETEKEAVIAEAEAAQLERNFHRDLPQIRSYLLPFLADGYQLRKDKSKGPASLSRIRSDGVLTEDLPGLEKLWELGTSNSYNDRPWGTFPQIGRGSLRQQAVIQPIEQAQALLRNYGDLLVARNMLAP